MTQWQPGNPIQLETERFLLRSLAPEDADEAYTSWWNDKEIQRGFNRGPHNWSREKAAQHIAGFDNKRKFHIGIFSKAEKNLIGFVTLHANLNQEVVTVNICIGDKAWHGKKVPHDIAPVLLAFVFEDLGMVKMAGVIKGQNLASITTTRALGLKKEAHLKSHTFSIKGGRTDVFHYGLLKREWQAMTENGG